MHMHSKLTTMLYQTMTNSKSVLFQSYILCCDNNPYSLSLLFKEMVQKIVEGPILHICIMRLKNKN